MESCSIVYQSALVSYMSVITQNVLNLSSSDIDILSRPLASSRCTSLRHKAETHKGLKIGYLFGPEATFMNEATEKTPKNTSLQGFLQSPSSLYMPIRCLPWSFCAVMQDIAGLGRKGAAISLPL